VQDQLTERSFLGAWFDPSAPLLPLLMDSAEFLPALIRTFRHEMRPYRNEPWFSAHLDELWRLKLFQTNWHVVTHELEPVGAVRALVPVQVQVPGEGELQFRLSGEPFTRDARFRIIYYFPTTAETIETCERWAERDSFG
jgi:hypothetical protein